jgi:serine O-acetyltransferase
VVLTIHRLAHWLWRMHIPLLPKLLKIVNRIVFSVVLPPSVQVGKGVLFSYQGLGTVVHKSAKIGDGAIISTGVTIGGRSGLQGAPEIGPGALIGTGAKVLGPVKIGKSASVGANAVVIANVPDYAVVAGVPARIIRIMAPGDVPRYDVFD